MVGAAEVVAGLVVVDAAAVVVGAVVVGAEVVEVVGGFEVVEGGVLTTEVVGALLVVAAGVVVAGLEEVAAGVEAMGAVVVGWDWVVVVADLLPPQPMNNEKITTRARGIPISFFKFRSFFPAVSVLIPAGSIMKCNTWRSRKGAGTLSGYGKTIQTFEHR